MKNYEKRFINCTLEEYQENLTLIDNACNPLGLINSLLQVVAELRESKEITATDEIMRHPIVKYFMQKLVDMTGSKLDYADVYEELHLYRLEQRQKGNK